MIINELLVDKYRVQKALDQATNHDISKYVEETHIRVKNISTKFSLNFKYGIPGNIADENMFNNKAEQLNINANPGNSGQSNS